MEHVARLAWTAGLPFMRKPLLRVALVRPLSVVARTLNQLGSKDKQFQVRALSGVCGALKIAVQRLCGRREKM